MPEASAPPPRRAAPGVVCAGLFAASGLAALVIETAWLRWFRLLFGATAPAAAATLVAFFAGQALGAALAARVLRRSRRPLALFGALELGAALWAPAVPLLLGLAGQATSGSYDSLRESPVALATLRTALALGATLPASLCLGAAFPAIGAAVVREPRALGTGGSALYAANLLGAALGAALAAFALFERFGVNASYAGAAALHALVGVAAVGLGRAPAPAAGPAAQAAPAARRADRALLGVAALSGFGTFAAQVLFVQCFAQVLNQSVYAFGAVVVTVLATLAAGSGLVALLLRSGRLDPRTLLGAALGVAAVGLALFPALLWRTTGGLDYVGSDAPWPGYLGAALRAAAVSAGPALLAAALVLPAVLARAAGGGRAAGPQLGRLMAANTLGAVAGALAAPFVLMPLLGPWASFAALGLLYAAAACLLRDARPALHAARVAALAAGGLAVALAANPFALPLVRLAPGERIVAARPGAAGVVAVVERDGERLIRTDNHYSLGGTAERAREERQGHLPLLLHPAARRVAFVGSATGITAGSALSHPVERITLVEIVPDVAAAARRFFADANRGVHDDPRSHTVLDDARNFFASTRETFDVVVGDLFVPWRSGTGSLYAREHFANVRARLAPDGLFCQWLPLYQLGAEEFRTIAATFSDVFARAALFRGDFFGSYPIVALVGWTDAPAAAASVSRAAQRLGEAGVADRWLTHPIGVWSLYVGPLAPLVPWLADAPRNTDAHPHIEFAAARGHGGGRRGRLEPLVGPAWLTLAFPISSVAGTPQDAVYPALPRAAADAARGGFLLQAAGTLHAEGSDEAGEALARAAELLPAALLAAGSPDPTAAEVWLPESAPGPGGP